MRSLGKYDQLDMGNFMKTEHGCHLVCVCTCVASVASFRSWLSCLLLARASDKTKNL